MLKLLLADMQREVFRHLLVVIDDHHGPPAKHVARADHNGIADAVGDLAGFFQRGRRAVGGLEKRQLLEQSLKTFAVFGAVDGVRAGAEDARFSGVWPPNWTITPSGRSFSTMCITSSKVSGSK